VSVDGRGNSSPPSSGGELPSLHELERECLEWCPICRAAEVVRATTPPEKRDQVQRFQRDALIALRGMLDSYLERMER
jgi:hypothetical protein